MSGGSKGNARGASKRSRSRKAASPTEGRSLRRQGRRTQAALLDAGMQVLAERGYHAARVDDVVRVAKVSHGTFYLYFSNKEDLFRALAVQCAEEMTTLTESLGDITPDEAGLDELRRWLTEFLATYRRYGVVIRAWMEDQVSSRELARLGAKTFNTIVQTLRSRLVHTGAAQQSDNPEIEAAAFLAMIERTVYFVTSRGLAFDDQDVVDTLARLLHRGFFSTTG